MDSVAIIVNPAAGAARGRLGATRARELLQRHGFSVEVQTTTRAGQAVELAARAAERHPVVAAVGGDGTCREIATGLLDTRAALALLPGGSGNDFARGLGIRSAEEGAAAAGRRTTRAVDIGFFGGRPFVNSAGLFLSGEVARRAARVPRCTGRLRYALGAAGALFSHRALPARWRLADEPARDGRWALAEIGNGPLCGGGFRLTPEADPSDGLLDFCLVEEMGAARMLGLFPAAFTGDHLRDARVACRRAATAIVRLEMPLWIHLDGESELLPAGEHAVRVSPGRLRVLAAAADAAGAPRARQERA